MDFVRNFVDLFFTAMNLAILARVLLSWVNPIPHHPVVVFLYQITEPILAPIRRYVPPLGMMDITPIVAMVLLGIIHSILREVFMTGF